VDEENMAKDAFHQIDDIHNGIINDNVPEPFDTNNVEEDEKFNEVNLEDLLQESRKRMFEGSNVNRLQCCIILFFLCTLYLVPHIFVDALLTWVARDLLLTLNCFPRSVYVMCFDEVQAKP